MGNGQTLIYVVRNRNKTVLSGMAELLLVSLTEMGNTGRKAN